MTTPTQTRTRQAIVEAAIEVLGQNTAASLGDIATAAQVGRTTLHRYFPERSDLLAAVRVEADARLERAIQLSATDDGPGGEALLRMCREYFDLGAVLSLAFGGATRETEPCWEPDDGMSMVDVIERGHADGSIDGELPPLWVMNVVWSQLYAAWNYRIEAPDASRHEVLGLLMRSLRNSITPAGERNPGT